VLILGFSQIDTKGVEDNVKFITSLNKAISGLVGLQADEDDLIDMSLLSVPGIVELLHPETKPEATKDTMDELDSLIGSSTHRKHRYG
jgi:hypothetical protein